MNNISVIIAGGGTGGHISPGIALYEEFREQGVRALFLATGKDRRFSSLDDIESGDLFFYPAPTMTRNILKLPVFAINFILAMFRTRSIILKFGVKAVIGMGGYVSAPALLCAKIMKVPVFLCEQNSVPGRVTRIFDTAAVKIFSTFEGARAHIKNGDAFMLTGNPIRGKVLSEVSQEEARKAFYLSHCRYVLLAIGGSQGALRINELIYKLKKNYPEQLKDTGIIWSTGDYSYKKYRDLIQNEMGEGMIYISPFIDNVGLAYRACDIAISRSGAGVMMELAAMGVPSVLIPYPHAAMNHQDKNADEFVERGAALKVGDADADPEKVAPVIMGLLNDPRRLKKMSGEALAVSKRDSSSIITGEVIRHIR